METCPCGEGSTSIGRFTGGVGGAIDYRHFGRIRNREVLSSSGGAERTSLAPVATHPAADARSAGDPRTICQLPARRHGHGLDASVAHVPVCEHGAALSVLGDARSCTGLHWHSRRVSNVGGMACALGTLPHQTLGRDRARRQTAVHGQENSDRPTRLVARRLRRRWSECCLYGGWRVCAVCTAIAADSAALWAASSARSAELFGSAGDRDTSRAGDGFPSGAPSPVGLATGWIRTECAREARDSELASTRCGGGEGSRVLIHIVIVKAAIASTASHRNDRFADKLTTRLVTRLGENSGPALVPLRAERCR